MDNQGQNKWSPAHNYHESLHRWGGYNSPPVEVQDMNNNLGRPPMWYSGVGRGRRARGPGGGGGGAGGPNRSMGRGRRGTGGGGGQNRNMNRNMNMNMGMGQGWPEEYPRPHPPPAYMDGIQQSQLVRRPGMAGAGRGGVRGMANVGMGGGGGDFDGYQCVPPGPPAYPHYSGGIRQSQLVKQPSASKPNFQRSSSSPSDLSTSPQQGTDGQLQREDRFNGGFMGGAGGCGQAPPSWPLPFAQSAGGVGVGSGVYRGLTEEQIKNEVGWHMSAIERAVKKVCMHVYLFVSNGQEYTANVLLQWVMIMKISLFFRLCPPSQIPPLTNLPQRYWSY